MSSLFVPEAYAARDPAAIVRRFPFALLITVESGEILASSIPMYFEADDSQHTLVGHLAGRNAQARSLFAGQKALAVFSGPHTYVSSGWYRAKPDVPTWNYVAAHVGGTVDPVDDEPGKLEILRRTIFLAEQALTEQGSEEPWSLEHAPPGRVQQLLPMVRAFRLRVERLEGVTKLSQRQPREDRLNVIRELLRRDEADSAEIARMMAALDD